MHRSTPFAARVTIPFLVVAVTYLSTADAQETDLPFESIVPNSWTLLPPEPHSFGRRFVSPTGDAWLRFFAVPVNREAAVNGNMNEVASPVPSGMRLEFGGGISGNMRLSFQAARSIG